MQYIEANVKSIPWIENLVDYNLKLREKNTEHIVPTGD